MRRQLPLLITMTLLSGLAFLALTRVQFSTSLFELLPGDLVEVRGMDWLNEDFSRDGQLIVTVSSPEAAITEETSRELAAELRAQTDLVSTIHEEMPLDRLARDGGSLLAWLWLNAEPSELNQLAARLSAPQSEGTINEAIALIYEGLVDEETMVRSYDPLALTRLPNTLRNANASEADAMTSPDKRFRLFYLEGSGVDFSNYRDAKAWLDKMKKFVAEWKTRSQLPDDVVIGLTGTPAFMAEVGTEMEKDMTLSVVLTMGLISLLFWIMHRQTQPLGWLIAALSLVLILTLTIGGMIFGKLSVMSAGFAAILLGLAVDYGIVLYREALGQKLSPAELRKKVGPAILWAAGTTAAVFLSLNFSSLPGIAEMGNLVAIGIAIGATLMIWGYGPIASKFASEPIPRSKTTTTKTRSSRTPLVIAALIPILALLSIFIQNFPRLEAEFHPFRIRSSPSMLAWQEMQKKLAGRENSIPIVMRGSSIDELQKNVITIEKKILLSRDNGKIDHFMLPFGVLPNPKNQRANVKSLETIFAQKERVLNELSEAGFSEEGSALTNEVITTLGNALTKLKNGASYAGPEGKFAEWSVGRLFREDAASGHFSALGSLRPKPQIDRSWVAEVCNDNAAVASLGTLGSALNTRINRDLKMVFLPMIGILIVMLGIVFRSWRDWLLALFCLVFSACAMVLCTLWTPLSWNSFNICGLPLLFGTGLDFGIHMIFALRRSGGDVHAARQGIGKALLFCGTSSAIGFGSLAFASAHGLASLGQICAVGILVNMAVAVYLLPYWYKMIHQWRN